jgi:hypothetical protein
MDFNYSDNPIKELFGGFGGLLYLYPLFPIYDNETEN